MRDNRPPDARAEDSVPCPACGYPMRGAPCGACGGTVLVGPHGAAIRPGRGMIVADIAHGFWTFFSAGLQLMLRPEYFGKLKLPLLANMVALAMLFAAAWFGLHELFAQLTASDWGWLDFLRSAMTFAQPVLALALTVITFFLIAPAIIETITSPFLDGLAGTVETTLGGPGLRAVQRPFWQGLVANVHATASVLVLQIAVLVPCLVLSFCGGGLVIAFVVCALLNALLWFEIPFARRGLDLRERIRVLRHNWARALGFGLAFQLGLFVPFFNFLLLAPTAAVAASMLYFHFEKNPQPDTVRRG
jgi:CysZ protein